MTEPDAKTDTDIEFRCVREYVLSEIDRDELVRLTRSLIRIPSAFRPGEPEGNEGGAARFVADYLRKAGFEVRAEDVARGRPNVWAEPRRGRGCRAHYEGSGVPSPGRLVLCHPVDEEGMMAGIQTFIENGHAEGVDAATAMYYANGEEAHV